MIITKANLNTLVRQILTMVFIIPYYFWWAHGFYFLGHEALDPEESCGLANATFIMLLLFVFFTYFASFLTLMLTSSGIARKDFEVAVAFVLLPLIFGILTVIIPNNVLFHLTPMFTGQYDMSLLHGIK